MGNQRRAWVDLCHVCGKRCYPDRKSARASVRRNHPGDHMTAYRCGVWWHVGHSDIWRDRRPEDMIWEPLPDLARTQMHVMSRGAA